MTNSADAGISNLEMSLKSTFEIREVDLARGNLQLAGASAGEALYREVLEPLLPTITPTTVLVLSLRGVIWITGSVLKATWAKVQDSVEGLPVAVAHLEDDVRHEFSVVCGGLRRTGVEAIAWESDRLSSVVLHGPIEEASLLALKMLIEHPGSTAPELHQRSGSDLQPTAWTNRLNELWRRGLAGRERTGRAWRFYAITQEVSRG